MITVEKKILHGARPVPFAVASDQRTFQRDGGVAPAYKLTSASSFIIIVVIQRARTGIHRYESAISEDADGYNFDVSREWRSVLSAREVGSYAA